MAMNVIIRSRPLLEGEKGPAGINVVCDTNSNEVSCTHRKSSTMPNKNWKFDKVFDQSCGNETVFHNGIRKFITPVIDGYSSTIFLYGQTKTGKSYTMAGEGNEDGIISKAVHLIYEELRKLDDEYIVTASYCEQYNEAISDLFYPNDQEIKVVEDPIRGLVCKGLSEITAIKESELQNKLSQAFQRKNKTDPAKAAYTHYVFTIYIYVKELNSKGDEYMRIGKLNMVELSGSECLSKNALPIDGDPKLLNLSLASFIKVINSIIDRMPHIPFRDSKLTRLLLDSFNGRCYSCFVGTVGLSSHLYEEMVNTLDFLSRVKSLRNRPEPNKRILKSVIVNDYSKRVNELENQFKDIAGHGIYIPEEEYQAMVDLLKQRTIELDEAYLEMDRVMVSLKELKEQIIQFDAELEEAMEHLSIHQENEEKNIEVATKLIETVEGAVSDVRGLHDKIERIALTETNNLELNDKYIKELLNNLKDMHKTIEEFQKKRDIDCQKLLDNITSFIKKQTQELDNVYDSFKNLADTLTDKFESMCKDTVLVQLDGLNNLVDNAKSNLNLWYIAVCDKIEKQRLALNTYHENKKAELDEYEKFIIDHCTGMSTDLDKELQQFNININQYQEEISNDFAEFQQVINDQIEKMTSHHITRYNNLTDCNTNNLHNEKSRVEIMQQGGKERIRLMIQGEHKYNKLMKTQMSETKESVNETHTQTNESYKSYTDAMKKLTTSVENDVNEIIEQSKGEASITEVLGQLADEIQSWSIIDEYDQQNEEINVYHSGLFSFISNMQIMMNNYLSEYQRTQTTAKTPREREYPISVEFPVCSKCESSK